jgi:hemerythrin superfamily protein
MNAIDLLKNDHKKIRELLAELAATTNRGIKKRSSLLSVISDEIERHSKIEEEIFYPAFKEASENSDDCKMYFESIEEHRAVGEMVLPDLEKTEPGSDQFSGRAKVLKELIEHHAGEEERDMFPRARKLMSAAQLRALGEMMAQRKRELANPAGLIETAVDSGVRLIGAVASTISPEGEPAAIAMQNKRTSRGDGSLHRHQGR